MYGSVVMRLRDDKWETQDTHECDNWISGELHVEECLKFMLDHSEVDFEVSTQPDYGSDRAVALLTGWRYSTEKEILDKEAKEAEFERRNREREEAEIAKLRKKRPDLFK